VKWADIAELTIAAVSLGSIYALMALGLVLVFGILRLINFAYGEFIMIGGYVMWRLQRLSIGIPWVMEAFLAVVLVVITSLVLERVAFRQVRRSHGPPINLLLTSFACSTVLQSLVMVLISPRSKGIEYPAVISADLTLGPLRVAAFDVVAMVVGGISLVGLTILLRRTFLGACLRAAADDFTMVRLLGVQADRVIAGAFAISGALAGISSVLYLARIGLVKPDIGLGPVIIAFFASVVGGMESLGGAVLGGFVLGFLTVGLQVILPASLLEYREAFTFLIIIVALLFRPQGLVPGRHVREVR
jgi:branched-chain amino acid transport system permease protein